MEILLRLCLLILTFFHWIYTVIKSWIYTEEEKVPVPPSDDPLLKLGAITLAQKIRERKIFSQEAVQTYIRRIKEVNPIINAVVEDRFEIAIEDAKQIDRYLDENPDKIEELKVTKPLFGVPITIKESIALKGLSYTGGSLKRKNIKAEEDSVVVQRLKEAGIIPLLVSNTPEYCTSLYTFNKIIGSTYNPYNTLYNSGGSSGGEGALLGAGASLIGIGSDICGSVRVPAMFNGVFGHKPTKKIVPLEGHWPMTSEDAFRNYLVIGPLTRYAEDLRPMLKIMAGPSAQSLKLDTKVDLSQIVVFYMEDSGNNCCLPSTGKEIKTAIKTAAAYLSKECHCHINNRKIEEFGDSLEFGSVFLMGLNIIPNALVDTEVKYNLYLEVIKEMFGKSIFSMQHLFFLLISKINKYIILDQKKYVEKLNALKEMVEDLLGDNGVIIYPCYPTSAFKVDYLDALRSCSTLLISNILGLPATAVPTGFDSNKMPIGIQVIAGPNQDRLTLAVAQELEKCFGGWQPVP